VTHNRHLGVHQGDARHGAQPTQSAAELQGERGADTEGDGDVEQDATVREIRENAAAEPL